MKTTAICAILCFFTVSAIFAQSSRKKTFGPKEESGKLINDMYETNRVLLIFDESNGSSAYETQTGFAGDSEEGFRQRNLVTFSIFDDNGIDPRGEAIDRAKAAQFRKKYDVARSGFALIVLDTDGKILHRSNDPMLMADIYKKIDETPERKMEIKQSRKMEVQGQDK